MPRPRSSGPTDGELEILQLLWELGPSMVRDVHEVLAERRGAGYTTVLKMLQIMMAKGLVVRDDSRRPHIYTAAQPKENVQGGLVGDLIARAFGGSAANLVMRALADQSTNKEDLSTIRAMLDRLEAEES